MSEPAAVARGERQPEVLRSAVTAALGDMVAMAVVDQRGVLTFVSPGWSAISGWSADEALGGHWIKVIHADDRAESRRVGRMIVESGEPVCYETRVVSRDGSKTTWIQCNIRPLSDVPGGEPTGWLVVVHDLTEYRETAEALAQSERRLQVIFDSSSDVVSILEPDGTRRATSASVQQLLGYPADWVPEDAPLNAIHPDDVPIALQAVSELKEQDNRAFGRLYEFRVITAEGETKWVETTGVNLIDEPSVLGIVLHTRDVTERKKAAEELQIIAGRMRSLVANLPVGVMLADEAGHIIYLNRAATQVLDIEGEPDELVRNGPRAMWSQMRARHPDFDVHLQRTQEIVRDRQPVLEEKVLVSDGRTLARSYVPIIDGTSYRGFFWIFEDLSEQVAMEAEREQLLKIEMEQNARLRELDSLKTDLVASVSHELRTPLTSIVSFTNLMLDGLGADSVMDQAEYIGVIARNTERLLRLVDDLLLLDRLESNTAQVSPEQVEIPTAVQLALTSIQKVATDKEVTLRWELKTGNPVRGDVGRLGQLIDNLLANAVKFTPPGGEVTVTAYPAGLGWCLEVSDTGIGIPANEIGNLFQRFFRASNARSQAVSGSGLGLAIARRVAELHGGGIEISSTEGQGTTVRATIVGIKDPVLPNPWIGDG